MQDELEKQAELNLKKILEEVRREARSYGLALKDEKDSILEEVL